MQTFLNKGLGRCSLIILIVLHTVITLDRNVEALNDSKDLLLTTAEQRNFMKTDFYLIRWIRAKNLDVAAAKAMLQENIHWRVRNNISQALDEDWSDLEEDYEMTFDDGHDREGRPDFGISLGDWDIRAAVLKGKQQRLQKYINLSMERAMRNIMKTQSSGKRVTRCLGLVDAENYNLLQHGCPACVTILVQWQIAMESYYPAFTDEVIIVNAPALLWVVTNSVRPFMSESTRNQLKIFDTNKKGWLPYLDKRVDRSQRSTRYGGTKPV